MVTNFIWIEDEKVDSHCTLKITIGLDARHGDSFRSKLTELIKEYNEEQDAIIFKEMLEDIEEE